jgi:hypothetical protein
VARAARAGGRVSSGQPRSLLFPGVLVAVVVLGMSLIIYAREDRRNDDLGGVPQLGDHIHQAFAINVCGTELEAVPEFESSIGIHTHGDSVIHIHPFSQLGVGANATLERYFKDAREGGVDLSLSSTELDYLGEKYEEGKTKCDGVDEPELRMAYWEDVQDETSDPEITTGDFTDVRLTTNGAGITIYYGDPDADIPRPANSAQLAQLGAADGGQVPDAQGNTTTSTAPASDGSTSTTSGEPSDSTTTTAAAGDTTTTAAP